MRKIKFRAWDSKRKQMSYDPIISDGTDGGMMSCVYMNTAIECNDEELMQFTGRQDKNWLEVYEGDVIGRKGFFNRVVIWNECGFATYSVNNRERIMPMTKESIDEFDEVIGNIHESKELL